MSKQRKSKRCTCDHSASDVVVNQDCPLHGPNPALAAKRARKLLTAAPNAPRCEGYHLHPAFGIGGGTGRWEQCPQKAIVKIRFRRVGKKRDETLPSCGECWKKCIEDKTLTIKKVTHLDKPK
jgi:hypothetical protein